MAVCTYDNPASSQRECWQDGDLVCAYSYRLFLPFAAKPIPAAYLFFGANVGPWKEGKMRGDREALP